MPCPIAFYRYFPKYISRRTVSTKFKVLADLDPDVRQKIENKTLKPRKHPGVLKCSTTTLPDEIRKAIIQVVGDNPMKRLIKEGNHFNNYLWSRFPPAEKNEINEKKKSLQNQVEDFLSFTKEEASEEELKHYNKIVESKVTNLFKKQVYNWKAVDYSHYMGLLYLIYRAPAEFSVMTYIFNNLNGKIEDDLPTTLFDFGSGVGTVNWASEAVWKDKMKEYYHVDSSGSMNEIAMGVLENAGFDLNKSFFRQFLPASHERRYDIVVSAFSLLELPSQSNRLQTLVNLWNKTKKYLIIVERGSLASFNVVNEARDFIIHNSKGEDGNMTCHVISPCPHDMDCPRVKSNDGTPCNFCVQYINPFTVKQVQKELFCYVILAKGDRPHTDPQWPRIVRPVLVRSRHSICRLCTNEGKLQEITFSSTKPDKITYHCARSSKWGDLLPVDIKYKCISTEEEEESI